MDKRGVCQCSFIRFDVIEEMHYPSLPPALPTCSAIKLWQVPCKDSARWATA